MTIRTFSVALAALVALVGSFAATPPAGAAQLAPIAPPATIQSIVTEVQSCGEVRAFCRGRFGHGPNYGPCVRNRGCSVNVRPSRNYCRRINRQCRYRWGRGQPYQRCMRISGC